METGTPALPGVVWCAGGEKNCFFVFPGFTNSETLPGPSKLKFALSTRVLLHSLLLQLLNYRYMNVCMYIM